MEVNSNQRTFTVLINETTQTMASQEASGSFMVYFDVMKYFNFIESELDIFRKNVVEIDNISYLPTSVIKLTMSEQEWKTMQSEVTTTIFGLEPIIFI